MYNVSTRHVVEPVDDFIEAAANKVMGIHCAKPEVKGDMLVFMPGTSSRVKRHRRKKLMHCNRIRRN
jgi:HrpA-like RNA helicase